MITLRHGLTVGLVSVALLLQGCATAAAQTKAAQSIPAPLAVAGARTVVELAPILLAVRNHSPGTEVLHGGVSNIADNTADVAGNAETQLLRYSVKRPDMRLIMTVVEGNYRLVARRSSGINSLADLKGKKVAAGRTSSSGYFLHKMVQHAGLKSSDVTLVDMRAPDMLAALEKREVDAIATWEPWSENALRALGGDAVEFSGKGVYREHYSLHTTAGALADPVKRRQVVALMRAIMDATEDMNRSPAEAQALVVQAGGFKLEDITRSWAHHNWSASFAEDTLDVMAEEEVWIAGVENRPPRSRAEIATLIDRSAYEEAKAAPRRK